MGPARYTVSAVATSVSATGMVRLSATAAKIALRNWTFMEMTMMSREGKWTPDCDSCKVRSRNLNERYSIDYVSLCPLHKAAPQMAEALREVEESKMSNGELGGGYYTLSGDTIRKIRAALRAAGGE